jgi:hypothetical protein
LSARPAVSFVFGAEQNVIKHGQWGTRYVPDERITYLTAADGTAYVWIAGGTTVGAGEAIAFTTPDLLHFMPRILKDGNAVASLYPNHPGSAAPDAGYSAPGSVFRAKNGRDLLMIYHGRTTRSTASKRTTNSTRRFAWHARTITDCTGNAQARSSTGCSRSL